jgi:hypothetical protein
VLGGGGAPEVRLALRKARLDRQSKPDENFLDWQQVNHV